MYQSIIPNQASESDGSTGVLEHLVEISGLLSSTEATEIILPLLLKRVETTYSTGAVALFGVDQDGAAFTLLAARLPDHHPALEPDLSLPRRGTLLDLALTQRTPIELRSITTPTIDPIIKAVAGPTLNPSGYVIPLRVGGAERGGLILISPRWDGDEAQFLQGITALADLAAVAIDRGRLRRAKSDDATRLEVLNAVLQLTGSGLDEETLILRVMETLLFSYPADLAELVTIDAQGLRLRYQHSPPGYEDGSDGVRSREQLHRRTIAERRAIPVDRGDDQFREEARYLIGIPIVRGDQALGSLLLGRHYSPFKVWEEELLYSVGTHLGISIELSRTLRGRAIEAEELATQLAEARDESRRIRDRVAELEEGRTRLQSLASLGELAAGVAHDLNNALNPVVAFAELIQEHSTDPDRVQMYADRILLAARGGAETVRRIHRFMRRRLSDVPLETIMVSELINQVIELTRPRWSARGPERAIVVEEAIDPELRVEGNPGELRQALLNLIGNALDAMRGGGTLRFVAIAEDDEALISVQDTGSGMPRSTYERAFEPFFTTKGVHGTGLGLAEVFGIAGRHGGTIELESFEGQGTTVTMRLPRTQTMPAPAKERRTLRQSADKLYRVLLVDDNLLNLEGTAAALRAAGHTVATASNAQAALRVFSVGRYDLVLSDLGLPDMYGLELVDRLRQRDPDIRVGLITGWTLQESDEELKRRGIDLLFVKPVDTDQLLAEL